MKVGRVRKMVHLNPFKTTQERKELYAEYKELWAEELTLRAACVRAGIELDPVPLYEWKKTETPDGDERWVRRSQEELKKILEDRVEWSRMASVASSEPRSDNLTQGVVLGD